MATLNLSLKNKPRIKRWAAVVIVLLVGSVPSATGQASNAELTNWSRESAGANVRLWQRETRGSRRSNRWYTFTAPDGDFTLSFPRKPGREADTQGPVTTIRTYSLTTDSGMRFSVAIQDVGGNPKARNNNEWPADQEEHLTVGARNNNEQIIQVHRVSNAIIELQLKQLVKGTGVDLNYFRRDIIRRGRVYTLSCGSVADGRETNKDLCRRFFQSIRLTR